MGWMAIFMFLIIGQFSHRMILCKILGAILNKWREKTMEEGKSNMVHARDLFTTNAANPMP
jgi:hypothetical protein